MPVPFRLEYVIERLRAGGPGSALLVGLLGVRLAGLPARRLLDEIDDHKWYLSERLGRDVGRRVAALDYLENVRERRGTRAA